VSQEIASLYATLGVKDQELQRGLTRAETRLNSTSAAMHRTDAMTSRLGQTMKRVAKGSLIGLGIGAGGLGMLCQADRFQRIVGACPGHYRHTAFGDFDTQFHHAIMFRMAQRRGLPGGADRN